MDKISYGCTPYDEPCAQVGRNDYPNLARIEGRIYIQQLNRILKSKYAEAKIRLKVEAYPHDYGTYHEVVGVFDENDPESVEQAYWLDENTPEKWDERAHVDLCDQGYHLHLVS